ncbi:hypothetical protein SSP24_34390 [Streptomyces spinoverrucosus]|uniref:Uncharacterized protein n=1 Tax=Streptomyces spinoverrucosus TaxID=284043 RepID=A0A4Y3VFW1_9ACTN|nr:hypothetical protein SSP24_34390 [Streptomyces spinoverrucosus]GHB82665.1 hypothetical protein GCM10010397_62310 [Streptomyces spinoverrucosus]
MPVRLDQRLHLGEHLLQRAFVHIVQDDGGQGPLVLRRQRHVGTGHGNGCWHAQLPVPTQVRPADATLVHRDDFIA